MLNINIPLLTWSCIVTALVTAFIITAIQYAVSRHAHMRNKQAHQHKLLEIGTETDEFYAPGDRRIADEFDD